MGSPKAAKYGEDAFYTQAEIDDLVKSQEKTRFSALADAIIRM